MTFATILALFIGNLFWSAFIVGKKFNGDDIFKHSVLCMFSWLVLGVLMDGNL